MALTISLAGSNTYTSGDIASLPGSAGQLAVFGDYVQDSSSPFLQVLNSGGAGADFTGIGTNLSTGGHGHRASYRVLTSSDVGSLYSMSFGDTLINGILLRFTITDGVVGTPASNNQQATTANPSVQTITPTSTYGIGVAYYAASAAVSPRTSSVTATGEVNSSTRFYAKYFVYDTVTGAAPSSFTVDMDDEGTNLLRSFWIPITVATSPGDGSASGAGDATAVGRAKKAAAGSATGTGTATAVGEATKAAAGSATGTGTATAAGTSKAAAAGSATGAGTATAVGTKKAQAFGDAQGFGDATAVGTAKKQAAGSASGTGTATGESVVGGSIGDATGAGTATGVGHSTAAAAGSSSGAGTATAVGQARAAAAGSATGTGTATGEGSSITPSEDYFIITEAGDFLITEAGDFLILNIASVGAATGTGTATAVGRATQQSAGTATGTGTATAVGVAIARGVGTATGTGTATSTFEPVEFLLAENGDFLITEDGDFITTEFFNGIAVEPVSMVFSMTATGNLDSYLVAIATMTFVVTAAGTLKWDRQTGDTGTWTTQSVPGDIWIKQNVNGTTWTPASGS